jgi:hypothetical protein
MFKKILIGALIAVVGSAIGFSVYRALANPSAKSNAVQSKTAVAGGAAASGIALPTAPALGAAPGYGQAQGAPYDNGTYNNPPYAGGQGRRAGQGGATQSNGRGYRGGRGNGGAQGGAFAQPNPQNGMTELVTYQGLVSQYAAPNLTLITTDGQSIPAQLGNLSYLSQIGLTLNEGDAVTLTGFMDSSGALAVTSITLDATGQTFTLRDNLGRPLWGGGSSG